MLTYSKITVWYPFFIFSDEVISYDDENKDVLYKIELFDELQNEVAETRTDNERLQQVIYFLFLSLSKLNKCFF
jgi:hypothetical protein